MKKIALFFSVLFLSSAIYSASFYYSVGAQGVSGKMPYGGFAFSSGCSFFDEPYLDIGGEIVFSPLFESAGISITTQPFKILNHPFDFLFANKMIYSPKLEVGAYYVHPDVWNIGCSLALLNFRDTMFSFEFFTPIFVLSIPDYCFGLGIKVLKITCYL